MLVIDKDIEFSLRQQAAWLNHGIPTVRVDTMQEAIEKLTKGSFYLVAINGDNVNYIPLLKIMCDMSPVHIFVLLSDFTIEKQNEAYINGATGCAKFQDDPEANVQSALAYLQSINARSRPKRVPKIVACGNLSIIHDHHQVFCNDAEVPFTKLEYRLLYYLLINRNMKLSYRQISRRVWRKELVSQNTIYQVIFRLRAALDKAAFNGGYIDSVSGMGYRFSANPDK